jgi:hypothetical protein
VTKVPKVYYREAGSSGFFYGNRKYFPNGLDEGRRDRNGGTLINSEA